MPFVRKYEERSDSLLADNIMAIVKEDFKEALDDSYPADNFPDFAERTLGRFFKLTYPTFNIDPDSNKTSDDGHYIEEEVKFNLFIAVEGTDAPTVTRNAMFYTHALKSVLRSATVDRYALGFPANTIFALDVQLEYEYGLIAKNGTGYEKPVSFELTLKFNER